MPEHWCDEPMARAGNDQCHMNYSPIHRLCKRLVTSAYPQPVTGALNPLRGAGCGRCVPQQECHQPPRATRPSRVCTVSCQGRRRRYRCRLVPRRKRRHRHRYRVATASPNAVPAKSQEHRRTTSDGTAAPQRRRSVPTDVNGSTTLETSRIGSPLTLRTRPRSDEEEKGIRKTGNTVLRTLRFAPVPRCASGCVGRHGRRFSGDSLRSCPCLRPGCPQCCRPPVAHRFARRADPQGKASEAGPGCGSWLQPLAAARCTAHDRSLCIDAATTTLTDCVEEDARWQYAHIHICDVTARVAIKLSSSATKAAPLAARATLSCTDARHRLTSRGDIRST